jgi:hypothetical protein
VLERLPAHGGAIRFETYVQDVLCRNTPAFLIVAADASAQRIAIIDDDGQFIGIDAMFWQQQVNAVRCDA